MNWCVAESKQVTDWTDTSKHKIFLLSLAGLAAWPAVLSRGSQGSRPPQPWWNGLCLSGWGCCLPFPVCCSLLGSATESRVSTVTQHILQGMCNTLFFGQEHSLSQFTLCMPVFFPSFTLIWSTRLTWHWKPITVKLLMKNQPDERPLPS